MGTSFRNLTAGNHHFGDSIQKVGRQGGRQERKRSRVLVMSWELGNTPGEPDPSPLQCSRLKPSYEFHFEGLSDFSSSVEELVQIQEYVNEIKI
jgi:hypothetical protein